MIFSSDSDVYQVVSNPQELSRAQLPSPEQVVVLTVNSGEEEASLCWLRSLLKQSGPFAKVVFLTAPHEEWVEKFINQGRADFVCATPDQLKNCIERSRVMAQEGRVRREALLEARSINRRLEGARHNLENEVSARTQREADLKKDSEVRRAQMRDLLRFSQALAAAQSLQELFSLIRRELKKYHGVHEPILAFHQGGRGLRLLYSRGGYITDAAAQKTWKMSARLRQNDLEDSQYLANEFGRPVGRILAMPLLARKFEGDRLTPTLFIEHQLSGVEVDELIHLIIERIQVLTIAIDRILLESELKSASVLWERTFDGMDEPVAILDPKGRVLRSNRHFNESRPSPKCHEAFADRQTPCEECPMAESFSSGQSQEGVVRRGSETFEVHSYPILDGQSGRVTAVVNHYIDLTSDILLHERMVQTEKMAALGHLAGHIAHELSNPLTGIRGLVQVLLAQQDVSEQMGSDLKEVERAAIRCQGIITNLLHFASGDDSLMAVVDLNEVVKNTLPLLKTAMSPHRTEFVPYPTAAWAEVHAPLLQQVVFNIIKNACQAMAEGGELSIAVEKDREPGHSEQQWIIRVTDGGVGMSEDVVKNLFTPFFTTKSEGEGTGLGLSLSRSLVERMGGRIGVDSAVGKGTTVRVWLKGSAKENQ